MILVLITTLSFGAEDPLGPIALAEAGTALARGQNNVGIVSNPGLLGLESRYSLSGFGQLGPQDRRGWGVSALDSTTSDFYALGLSYSGSTEEPSLSDEDLPGWTPSGKTPDNVKRHHDITMAIGVPILQRFLSVGAHVDWALYDHDQQGTGSVADVGLGLAGRPTAWLTLGVALRNLWSGDPLGDHPLGAGGGAQAAWKHGGLNLESTWDVYQDSPGVALGGHLGTPKWRVHAGWRQSDLSQSHQAASTGLSYHAPTLTLAYGLSAPLGDDDMSGWTHMLGLQIPMSVPGAEGPNGPF
jgi:hypothetical protein